MYMQITMPDLNALKHYHYQISCMTTQFVKLIPIYKNFKQVQISNIGNYYHWQRKHNSICILRQWAKWWTSNTLQSYTYFCLGWIPGTISISAINPVQLLCSGKSTHTSSPFLLTERTTPTLVWVTQPHLYLKYNLNNYEKCLYIDHDMIICDIICTKIYFPRQIFANPPFCGGN